MIDKKTAYRNLVLALELALVVVLLFAGTILIGEIVIHS
jgi:hypothetical protein